MRKFVVLVILMTTGLINCLSQSDTIIISEEQVTRFDEKCDPVYKLFIEGQDREINHLWKFDLIGFSFLVPNIGFEQKIVRHWSSNTILRGGYASHTSFNLSELIGIYSYEYGLGITQQFRYYHNLGRRKRLGKDFNGFSGNFFALSFSAGYSTNSGRLINVDISYSPNKDDYFNYRNGVYYGLQRRIGNIGFFEVYMGVTAGKQMHKNIHEKSFRYEDLTYTLDIGINAGFAIDSFKNIKRMFCQ